MTPRNNQMLASQVDAALILLPLIGQAEALRMLTQVGVSTALIERVLTRPAERRAITDVIPAYEATLPMP